MKLGYKLTSFALPHLRDEVQIRDFERLPIFLGHDINAIEVHELGTIVLVARKKAAESQTDFVLYIFHCQKVAHWAGQSAEGVCRVGVSRSSK